MEDNNLKLRSYCFTKFNDICSFADELKLHDDIKYCAWQIEQCPTTKRFHIQGYIEFKKPMRFAAIKQMLGNDIHIERRKGTRSEAIEYCRKPDSRYQGPYEYGNNQTQGERTDLKTLANDLKNYGLKHVVENMPEMCIKFSKGIQFLKAQYDKMNATKFRLVEVILLEGPPGCGKTSWAFNTYSDSDIYILNCNSNNTLWFDGYDGEKVLLIDDYKGWIKYTELLKILDIYPYRCQIKGSYTYALWDKVIITSNYDYHHWYNEGIDIRALERRIKIHLFNKNGKWDKVRGNTNPDFVNYNEVGEDC